MKPTRRPIASTTAFHDGRKAIMKLRSCRKNKYGRCLDPAVTARNLESILSKYDYWIHEEQVAPRLHWSALFIENMDFRAMGKGTDAIQSRAGALAEAAEWLTPSPTEKLPGYVTARQDELENPLEIEALLPHIANATPPVLERIKSSDSARHWVDGYSLMHDRTLKVPIEYVRLIHGPNGKAAGNCLEEALVHATNEVFERRVHVTVLRNKMVMPTIMPSTIPSAIVLEYMAFMADQEIEVTLKDLSFGGVMPCIGAYFKDRSIPPEYQFHHSFKVGASFNKEEALIRVFTEYVQGRRNDEFLPRSPESLARILKPDFRSLLSRDDSCDNFLSSFMFGFVPYRDASFLEKGKQAPFENDSGHEDCLEDIAHARRVCETLGLDYIAVDMSDPSTSFAVVQVVIPGYSDVLPFHPPSSPGLFRQITRTDVLKMYEPSAGAAS